MAVIYDGTFVDRCIPSTYSLKDLKSTYRFSDYISADQIAIYKDGNLYVRNYQIKDRVDKVVKDIKIPDAGKSYIVCVQESSQQYLKPIYCFEDKRVMINVWYTLRPRKQSEENAIGSMIAFDVESNPVSITTRTGLHTLLEARQKSVLMLGDGKTTDYGNRLYLYAYVGMTDKHFEYYLANTFEAEPVATVCTELNAVDLINIANNPKKTVVDEKWTLSDLLMYGGHVECDPPVEITDDLHSLPSYVIRITVDKSGIVVECKGSVDKNELIDTLGHEDFTINMIMG